MKVIDALNRCEEIGDFDVVTDYGCWRAYSGTKLTEAGLERYKKCLDLDCHFVYGTKGYTRLIVTVSTVVLSASLEKMLSDMSGYCSPRLHAKYFKD